MIDARKRAGVIATLGILGLLTFYAIFQARNLIEGPVISLETPQKGASVEESLLTLKGTTRNIAKITLNDSPIFVNENGAFQEQILLPEGYAILVLKAFDRFGREKKEIIPLYNHAKENRS